MTAHEEDWTSALRGWWDLDGRKRRLMWRGRVAPESADEAQAALDYAIFVQQPAGVLVTLLPRLAAVAVVVILMAVLGWEPGRTDGIILTVLVVLDLAIQFSYARKLQRSAANWTPEA